VGAGAAGRATADLEAAAEDRAADLGEEAAEQADHDAGDGQQDDGGEDDAAETHPTASPLRCLAV
jgi:hypothetical protein